MSKVNVRTKTEDDQIDPERELPASAQAATTVESAERSGLDEELQKLKAERDFREFAAADTIKSLLPVLDSFELALNSKSDAAEFRNGIELIYKQLQNALAKLSLQPIAAKGEPFNPHLHEAIEMVETSDAPDHQVLEELQRGYKLKDRLLRPAMVKVARNPGR
jgi:molecular chaperone GrpE